MKELFSLVFVIGFNHVGFILRKGQLLAIRTIFKRITKKVSPEEVSFLPVLYADFQFGGSGGFLTYNSSLLLKNTQNRVFGSQGQAHPFRIMTHSEYRNGASV